MKTELDVIGDDTTIQTDDKVTPQEDANKQNAKEKKPFSLKEWFMNYLNKFKTKEKSGPLPHWSEYIFSFIGSMLGIGLVASLHYHVVTERSDYIFMIGSFGASAVLIFGATKSPLAQPRNMVLGHFVSAIVGVTIRLALVKVNVAFACTLAVSLAIVAMHLTKSLHPPGGATALLAVTTAEQMWAGYFFIFVPVLTGALSMIVVALLINNLSPQRKYPVYWY